MTRTVVIALALLTLVQGAASEPVPRFHICPKYLLEARAAVPDHEPQRASVFINLTPAGIEALEKFTYEQLGNEVAVLAGKTLVLQVKVQGIIDSGRIQSHAFSYEEANQVLEALDTAPAAPCGPAA